MFSDLDGSLLDHDTYSFAPALATVRKLQEHQIPLILASSKTSAEIERIRQELENTAPFIVENGAAIFIPEATFPVPPPGTIQMNGYQAHVMTQSRQHWLNIIREVGKDFPDQFETFSSAGTQGIMKMTGLSAEAAARANLRDYSEPVQWRGDNINRNRFVKALAALGASVQQGGRFMTVGGACDKGTALHWLRSAYQQQNERMIITDIAIGDSQNDSAMLEAAQTALLVRSPVHTFPELKRTEGILYSVAQGPEGWAQGVTRWLQDHHLEAG